MVEASGTRVLAFEKRLPLGLPRLAGRAFVAFQAIWILALLGAAAGLTIGEIYTWERVAGTTRSFNAFGLHIGVEVPVTLYFPLSAAARRAGIADKDRIVAVDGVRVPDDARPQDIAPMLDRAGAYTMIRTRAADGRIADHRLVRDPRQSEETYKGTGLSPIGREAAIRGYDTLTALFLIGAAVLLFVRRPRDPVAATLSVAFLLLIASYSWTWLLEDEHARWLVAFLRPTAWSLVELVLLTFPTGRFEPRWTIGVAAAILAIWVYWVLDVPASTGNFVGLINMVVLLLALYAMRTRFRTAPMEERQQIKWAMLGFAGGTAALLIALIAAALVPAVSTNLHVLIWAETIRFFALITMITSFALGLLVSLLRYRLYDADAIISRSAGYAVMTLMIGAIWAGSERGIEHVVSTSLGHEAGNSATIIAAAIAAVLVAPAHNRVHKWAEQRFQKALVHLRHGLPSFVEDMRETAQTHELLEETLDRLEKGVRASHGAVLLGPAGALDVAAVRDVDPDAVAAWRRGWHPKHPHVLECDREDPLFPLRLRLDGEAGTIGWILLGPRPDGSFYGKDEREALAEIAEPIARAIGVSRRRDARWQAVHDAIATLGRRVAELEQTLSSLPSPQRSLP